MSQCRMFSIKGTVPKMKTTKSGVRSNVTAECLLLRDHSSRARLQQEAGGSVVCSVSGPAALPPGSDRGVFRSHQEEGRRNCTSAETRRFK